MKISPWPLLVALTLGGCISKTKYDAELENLEKVYTRIDRMTDGMNQMGGEINRLREQKSEHKRENEVVIKKLRIDELKVEDVEPELQAINRAMQAYRVHHAAGDELVTHFNDLKVKGADALAEDHIHFLAKDNHIGFVIETAIFAPANSPKLDGKLSLTLSKLVDALNDFDAERYQVIAHVDNSMPTGKRYETVSDLGLDRALNVVTALIEGGVKPNKLSAAAVVARKPISTEASKEERAWARRIEIRVIRDLVGNPGFETFNDIETGKLRL